MENNNKKLLIITSTFPRSKDDTDPRFVMDLCSRLVNFFNITVLCPNSPECKSEKLTDRLTVKRFRYFFKNLEVLAYGTGILSKLQTNKFYYLLIPFFIIGEIIAITNQIRKTDFDIINPHWLIPQGFAAVIACRITGQKKTIICTLHGGDLYSLKGSFFKALKKYTLKRASAISVVSTAMRKEVLSLGAAKENIYVIPMGIDLKQKFVPGNISINRHSILFVGRLVEKKGVQYLIDAFFIVCQKYSDANLVIVGKGPEEGRLRRQVQELKLESSVEFKGALLHDNLPSIYQSHSIAVFPFIQTSSGDMEGFGLVMVEAMGCGCAVVATDLPAVHDIIIDHKTGLIVRQKNSDEIADKIICLFQNSDLLDKLSKQGRAYAEERFDGSVTQRKYTEMFTKTMRTENNQD